MKPGQTSDAELARRVQEGDLAAFRGLVERYQGPFYRMACRALGEAAAEEAAQEAFTRIFRWIDSFDPARPFAPWAWRTLSHVVADQLAECRRKPEVVLAEPPAPAQAPRGEGALLVAESRRLVREAVVRLPEPYRETVLLHYFAGLGVAAISEGTGRPVNTVKVHLHRARKRLLELLAGEEALA